MCGINGIAFSSRSDRQINRRVLEKMRDVLYHRGPDAAGFYVEEKIGFGHRRLSIVDVAGGAQPMFNEDERVVITYNGEIYNHADYRAQLEAKGYKYQTHSDTETILHLYEEYGADCLQFLRGMFAFAIWDKREKQLFIARDRLGVKPLYYVADAEGNLFFASEIKSLLEARAVRAEINYRALPDMMANHGTSGEETLFKDVKRLLPGHFLIWKDGKLKIQKYWDISFEPKHGEYKTVISKEWTHPNSSISPSATFDLAAKRGDWEFVEEWRELFKESVRLRLMADVPLGMFLSGGIDSSAICAMMADLVDAPVKTFSVGFKEREANEFEYARIVSQAFQTEHYEITITPEQFFGELPNLVWHEDEPLGFDSSIPLYFVSKLARQHVKVVLTGEGSDELLAGYARYHKTLLNLSYGEKYESLTPTAARALVKTAVGAMPRAVKKKLSRTFLARPSDIENLYLDNFAVFPKFYQEKIFTPETKAKIENQNPYRILKNYLAESDAKNLLDQMLYADTKTYLHELLMKQDQMSMAASVESRVPFLDHRLVEYTAKLPEKLKLRGKTTKWILRQAMKGVLPDEILRRPKMGFPVPLGDWLRGRFRRIVEQYVLSERALARGIFEPNFARELVARHDAGEDHARKLFFLINFEIWQRRFIDGD